MAFPSASLPTLNVALSVIQNYGSGIKPQAAAAALFMSQNNVDTNYVFATLDKLSLLITTINQYKNMAGLNAYATANIPGYAGTLTADIAAVITAAQNCITWVVTNAAGVVWYTLNSDGSRTAVSFTPSQTAGLQAALNALAATIN